MGSMLVTLNPNYAGLFRAIVLDAGADLEWEIAWV